METHPCVFPGDSENNEKTRQNVENKQTFGILLIYQPYHCWKIFFSMEIEVIEFYYISFISFLQPHILDFHVPQFEYILKLIFFFQGNDSKADDV